MILLNTELVKRSLLFSFFLVGPLWLVAGDLRILGFSREGWLTVSNTFSNGVCAVEEANEATDPWQGARSVFTTGTVCQVKLTTAKSHGFYRAIAADLSGGREGFTNLIYSYDLLTTVAGAGGTDQDINKWQPTFEGAPATNVELSRPHQAMADAAGNIYIADKSAHAIRKVLVDGTLVTVAGVNEPGDGPDDLTLGTQVALNEPNGLWTRADGTTYILDLRNGKVRRLDPAGMMMTLFAVPGGITVGRGLWVSEDETLVYFASLTVVKRWTPPGGVEVVATGFVELGNLAVDPAGNLVVTDRGGHRVWRIDENGDRTAIAGNGSPSGGGDGELATATGLNEVRGVWFLPTGAYFLVTHRGSQVWYVDTEGYIHLFLHGLTSDPHAGDGTWFYAPDEPRVSENRAITADLEGNLLITEHDSGYVRKVQFRRHVP